MSRYRAKLLDLNYDALLKEKVNIVIEKRELLIQDQDLSLDLNEIQLEIFGTNDDTIKVTSVEGGVIFLISNDSFIEELSLVAPPKLLEQIKQIKKKKFRFNKYFLIFITIVLLLGILFLTQKQNIVKMILPHIPITVDTSISEYSSISSRIEKSKFQTQNTLLKKLASNILPDKNETPFKFKVLYSDSEEDNAYAYPGGTIFITKGFIKNATSANEFYGVLAHEVAHVTERHGVRSILDNLWYAVIFGAIFDVEWLGKALTNLISLGYSREIELEADMVAHEYLHQRGLSSYGLRQFFERHLLTDESEILEKSGKVLNLFSTHPDFKARVQVVDIKRDSIPIAPELEELWEELRKTTDN